MIQDNLARKEEKKILDCREIFDAKANDNQFAYEIMAQIKVRAEQKAIDNAEDIIQEKIKKLEADVKRKQIKLQFCIPVGMIACSIVIACVIVSCATMLIFQLISNVTIIDYHVIVFAMIGAIGLFHTSISTIRNWKRYIEDEER